MKTKTFDAVKMMREIRDQLSRDMEQMTPEERIQYIRDKAALCDMGDGSSQDDDDGTAG